MTIQRLLNDHFTLFYISKNHNSIINSIQSKTNFMQKLRI